MKQGSALSYALRDGLWVPVVVRVHIQPGLPSLSVVGARLTLLRGLSRRLRAALGSVLGRLTPCRITISLEPNAEWLQGHEAAAFCASLRALGYAEIPETPVFAEIDLDGGFRSTSHTASLLYGCSERITVSVDQESLACLREGVLVASSIRESFRKPEIQSVLANGVDYAFLGSVSRMHAMRRLISIAACGAHPLYLCGRPGVGKSMLLRAAAMLLPPLASSHALRASAERGAHSRIVYPEVRTASEIKTTNSPPKHATVLLAEELPLWSKQRLLWIREVLDACVFAGSGSVWASANPCACGFRGTSQCVCTPAQLASFDGALSPPLRDRFHLYAWVDAEYALEEGSSEDGQRWLREVYDASKRDAVLETDVGRYAQESGERLGLSPRACVAVRAVAITIAKIERSEVVSRAHVDEAMSYRFR